MPHLHSHDSRTTIDAAVFSNRWQALHRIGQEIGGMAALAEEPLDEELSSFPERIAQRGGPYLTLANEGVEDLDAILQPGLTALRTIRARGQDTTAPALALWREFHALRSALLNLASEPAAASADVPA